VRWLVGNRRLDSLLQVISVKQGQVVIPCRKARVWLTSLQVAEPTSAVTVFLQESFKFCAKGYTLWTLRALRQETGKKGKQTRVTSSLKLLDYGTTRSLKLLFF
jgi:hypothetical protein